VITAEGWYAIRGQVAHYFVRKGAQQAQSLCGLWRWEKALTPANERRRCGNCLRLGGVDDSGCGNGGERTPHERARRQDLALVVVAVDGPSVA